MTYYFRAVIFILIIHTGLLAYGAFVHSPSIDEPTYLVAGLKTWEDGSFEYANVSPPGVRLLATSLLHFLGISFEMPESVGGDSLILSRRAGIAFLNKNGPATYWAILLARLTCIPISILGALLCCCWSTKLYGRGAGLLALLLWCFCPMLLTQGQMITPDMGGAVFFLAAAYSFWLWLSAPDLRKALTAGALLGLSQLMRTTSLVLYPAFAALWLIKLFETRRCSHKGSVPSAPHLMLIVAMSLMVLNSGYLFDGSFQRLKDYELRSSLSNSFLVNSWIGSIPLPLPKQYVLGIDRQRLDFEAPFLSYFNGEFRIGGWWYYYLIGLLMKLPIGTIVCVALAAMRFGVRNKEDLSRSDELALLLPLSILLFAVSAHTGFNHHLRYILPALPLLYIWTSRILYQWQNRNTAYITAIALLLTQSTASSLSVYPHTHSFFNILAGGPRGGHRHFIDSNIDWGQDLHYLNAWIREQEDPRSIKVGYFGNAFESAIELPYTFGVIRQLRWRQWINMSESHPIEPGWYAISINLLKYSQFFLSHPSLMPEGDANYPIYCGYFLELTPHTVIGNSIYIYKIGEEEIKWLADKAKGVSKKL